MEWNAMTRFINSLRATKQTELKEETEQVDEASYSAKAARAGKDIGKPGKNFEKIAKSAGEKYGSKEAGKRVAGAILAKLRKEEVELEESDKPEFKSTYARFNAKTAEKKLAALAEPKDKVTKKDVLVGRGVLPKREMDESVEQTIEYKTAEVEIKESDMTYKGHFDAALSTLNITSPKDLAEEDFSDFFALVDECFRTKDEMLFLEAWMMNDVKDKINMHRKAGNKISDEQHTNRGGQSYHSFVVTEPSGKRTRHIYHGNSRKLETMSPAPKSKEAHETGEDEDDK